jgi:NADH-quinone oxidoreductase subunit N
MTNYYQNIPNLFFSKRFQQAPSKFLYFGASLVTVPRTAAERLLSTSPVQCTQHFVLFLPQVLIAATALLCLILCATAKDGRSHFLRVTSLALWGYVTALAALCFTWPEVTGLLFNLLFIHDLYGAVAKVVILVFSAVVLVATAGGYSRSQGIAADYVFIYCVALLGILLLIDTFDFLSVFLSYELTSIALYALAAKGPSSPYVVEAAAKYFILGSLASALMLLGISIVYGVTGTTNFLSLKCFFNNYENYDLCADIVANVLFTGERQLNFAYSSAVRLPLSVSVILIVLGILCKLAGAPFHMWALDVYDGVWVPVSAFFLTVVKLGIFFFFARVLHYLFYSFNDVWAPLLSCSGLFSLFFGSLGGLQQNKIKRLIAYSSLVNVGILLLLLSANTVESLSGFFLYLLLYVSTNTSLFCFVLSFVMALPGQRLVYITDLSLLRQTQPLTCGLFSLLIFSMAGLPPLGGFFGKYLMLTCIFSSGLYFTIPALLLVSLLSAFYYVRLVKIMFFDVQTSNQIAFVQNKVSWFVFCLSTGVLSSFFSGPHSGYSRLSCFLADAVQYPFL